MNERRDNQTVRREKQIHLGYKEWEKAVHGGYTFFRNVVGKYQYIYTSDLGKISLVELPDYFRDGKDLWEIYCLEGDLFEDVERFDSQKEGEKQAKEYLTKRRQSS